MPSEATNRGAIPTLKPVEAASFERALDLKTKREDREARATMRCAWPGGCDTPLLWDNDNGLCGAHLAKWKTDERTWNETPPGQSSRPKRKDPDEYVYLDGLASLLEAVPDPETGKPWVLRKLGHAVGLYDESYRRIRNYARTDREKYGARCRKDVAEKLARALGVAYEDLRPRRA